MLPRAMRHHQHPLSPSVPALTLILDPDAEPTGHVGPVGGELPVYQPRWDRWLAW